MPSSERKVVLQGDTCRLSTSGSFGYRHNPRPEFIGESCQTSLSVREKHAGTARNSL